MKVLLLNGSPRDGNTKFAVETIGESIAENISGAETEILNVAYKKISACMGCDVCKQEPKGFCIFDDDMNEINEKVGAADMIVFASPVYWWGISAQLKTVIDRLYALTGAMDRPGLKIGLFKVGGDDLNSPQYEIISNQFKCICDYLKWDLVFDKSVSASGREDVKNNEAVVNELKELWKQI